MRLDECFHDLDSRQRSHAILLLLSASTEIGMETAVDLITNAYRCVNFKKLDATWFKYRNFLLSVKMIVDAKCSEYTSLPRATIEDIFVRGIQIGWSRDYPWVMSLDTLPKMHDVLVHELKSYRACAIREGLC